MDDFHNKKEWIRLALVPGLGPVKAKALLEAFGSPLGIFSASTEQLRSVLGLGPITACSILEKKNDAVIVKEVEKCARLGVHLFTSKDEEYPKWLKEIYDPPILLYWKGKFDFLSRPAVAIVGTRKATPYGVRIAEKMGEELASSGITVVSGLANGIDSAAHRGALKKGRTIAVMGSGVDQIYPPGNRNLAMRIIQQGALVSEFPLATPPDRRNFPRRNRIISGMSRAIVVVEAGEKSGTMITVRCALEQGREVFAVPGPVNSSVSAGTHRLIREGARSIRDASELMEDMGWTEFLNSKESFSEDSSLKNEILTADEKKILAKLGAQPQSFESLRTCVDLCDPDLSLLLLELVLKGEILMGSGNQYFRVGEI